MKTTFFSMGDDTDSHGSFLWQGIFPFGQKYGSSSNKTIHVGESHQGGVVGSELTGHGHDLATRMHVVHHLLLQSTHVLL